MSAEEIEFLSEQIVQAKLHLKIMEEKPHYSFDKAFEELIIIKLEAQLEEALKK